MGSELRNTDLHCFLNLLHYLILEGGFAEDVVWSNTRLTTIHVLSPGYASGEKTKQNQEQNTFIIPSPFRGYLVGLPTSQALYILL